MNLLSKIFIALVLLAGLSGCTGTESINTDTDQVYSAADEIVNFDLPAGYDPDFSTHLMGYTVAAFNPGDGHSHLYLIQSENESDGEKLADMLDRLAVNTGDPQTHMTVIETRPVTVRGQEVTLVISDGVNSEGASYRQAAVAFQGLGGPVLLVISEPVDSWDQAKVDALLASIH